MLTPRLARGEKKPGHVVGSAFFWGRRAVKKLVVAFKVVSPPWGIPTLALTRGMMHARGRRGLAREIAHVAMFVMAGRTRDCAASWGRWIGGRWLGERVWRPSDLQYVVELLGTAARVRALRDSDAALDVASSDSVREPSTHDVEPSASAPGSAPPSTPSCAQLTEASPRTSTATRSSSATSPRMRARTASGSDLWVRPTTQLSGPLAQEVANGAVNLRYIP